MTRNNSRPQNRRTPKRSSLVRGRIRLETSKRIIIFSIATLILGCAQCSFFSVLNICPRTPDLILGLILAVALCDNDRSAMALAVGAGFFIDAIGGGRFALSPLIYFIYAVIISIASQKMLKSFPSFVLLLLPSLLYRAIATTAMTLIYGMPLNGNTVITLLLEALCTFILCLPIYPIMALATKPLSTHKRFSF